MEVVKKHNNTDLIDIEQTQNTTDLINSMVHDFTNLLTTISGLTQLSIMKTREVETASNLKVINYTILDCKIALDKIYGCVIGCTKSEKNFNSIDEIVFSSLDMIRYRTDNVLNIGEDNISLDVELNSKEILYCNKYEIRQVLINIMVNGIHAMDGYGGILKVRTYNVDDDIVITIEDTGMGIEEEDLNKIFGSYYTTKGKNGTGLGLKIVKTIVEDHLGNITVNSEVSKGSKFVIKFPKVSNIKDLDME